MQVPSALLLRYFELASRNLQALIDSPSEDDLPPPSEINLDWHRRAIIKAQMISLDETLLDWKDVNRDDVQAVLRQMGEGDFTGVDFDSACDKDNQQQLAEMMDVTNDLARMAFSNSVLFAEWNFDSGCSQSRVLKKGDDELDKPTILEYCGLAMRAVRFEAVRQYLETGKEMFPSSANETTRNKTQLDSAKSRLEYVQHLIWRSLGWNPDFASNRLQQLFSDGSQSRQVHWLAMDEAVVESLTKYSSAMTVAVNNATPLPQSDDGTTRIINVSYSEKIVTVPQHDINNEDTTIASLSAPSSHAMHEHSSVQQRQQLEIAQKTSMLQQQIWDDFESLSDSEQIKTIEKAETVQREFLDRVMNTPPGPDRVLVMQSLSGEDQKLLVLHKLWSTRNAAKE